MDVFTVLADPIRREIVEALADGPLDAGSIANRFTVSRPAVSRHLRILRQSGLTEVAVDAQRRIYRLRPEPLAEMDAWLGRYRRFWNTHLDRLADHLEEGT